MEKYEQLRAMQDAAQAKASEISETGYGELSLLERGVLSGHAEVVGNGDGQVIVVPVPGRTGIIRIGRMRI